MSASPHSGSDSDLPTSSSEKKPPTSKHNAASSKLASESLELLALAEQMAHLGSWQFDTATGKALWSPELFRIFHLPPQPYGLSFEDYRGYIHPDEREFVDRQMMQLRHLNDRVIIDYHVILRDGAVRGLHSERVVKEADGKGFPRVIVGIEQDVTEQKKAEKELRESEARFRFVAEAANVMVYETDVATGRIRVLRGLEELVGYKPEEVDLTVDWVLNQMHPDDVKRVEKIYEAVIDDPAAQKYVLEYRFRHKNGNYIVVKDTAKAVKDASGKTVLFIGGIRDITQRRLDKEKIEQYSKHLEEIVQERTKQLIAYERFAAIGQVAGMVGHDIRNPLQALISEVYLLRTDLSTLPQDEAKESINESLCSIERNISYINKILADLQDYSRQLTPEYSNVDLSDLIVNMFESIAVPDAVELLFDIESMPQLRVDPTFIRRALTNLINNAIQAMPNGGKLKISSHQENGYVCLTVTDTGVGIADELKTKLFTPMFTTKAKGQGLGLAVVKRLIEAQGGTVSFESAVGKGTRFTVKLPLPQNAM